MCVCVCVRACVFGSVYAAEVPSSCTLFRCNTKTIQENHPKRSFGDESRNQGRGAAGGCLEKLVHFY